MTAGKDHTQAILVVAFTGLLAMLLTACSTTPTTTYDDTTNFTPPKTFAWISEHPLKTGDGKQPVNPFLEQYLMEATRSGLKEKGYQFVDSASQADFSVAFSIGMRDKIRVDSYPGYVGVGRRGFAGGGYWGAGWGVGGTTAESYTEGQLSIDLFDEKTKKPVWHGSYSRRVTESDKKKLQDSVNQLVAKILSEFPPPATK